MELTHTRLLVDCFRDCFIFYRDVMGFEAIWGTENDTYATSRRAAQRWHSMIGRTWRSQSEALTRREIRSTIGLFSSFESLMWINPMSDCSRR
ncbi:hypothetical protein DFQ01_10269 [Paenibacillus cellulosilyticus]|uniref:Uncharacterized protein n=1 Tax=Paenibacillus cellulosilyticus TaxID=375489 RepID=A0A2V2YZG1_9BACL|nr:hypothetical protein DFQ01_10269 [Paenibacillus cellulosilyticus]